jgi:excisionase family DNA binding protein
LCEENIRLTNTGGAVPPEIQDQIDRLNSRLWPVEAVMERLSIGRSMVFELMASGQLRSCKVGRRRLVSESAINEYIARVDQTGGDAA